MMKYIATAATLAAYTLAATPVVADGHAITLRATANSNENDEDYDGLIVFKNYVEAASNGAINVELFIGAHSCVRPVRNASKGSLRDPSTSISPPPAGRLAFFPMFRSSTCPT